MDIDIGGEIQSLLNEKAAIDRDTAALADRRVALEAKFASLRPVLTPILAPLFGFGPQERKPSAPIEEAPAEKAPAAAKPKKQYTPPPAPEGGATKIGRLRAWCKKHAGTFTPRDAAAALGFWGDGMANVFSKEVREGHLRRVTRGKYRVQRFVGPTKNSAKSVPS